MNILFFLTPKNDVAYINEDDSLRQALERMEYHRYTAIPVLDTGGHYSGTVSEGDLLRVIREKYDLSMHEAEDIPVKDIPRRGTIEAVDAGCDIEDLIHASMRQNFVPVTDDHGVFIGIITRKAIIQYCYEHSDLKVK